jgi:hypothetical protein
MPLALALLGCSRATPRTTPLAADQAGALAQQLANEKAQALFHCSHFTTVLPRSSFKDTGPGIACKPRDRAMSRPTLNLKPMVLSQKSVSYGWRVAPDFHDTIGR